MTTTKPRKTPHPIVQALKEERLRKGISLKALEELTGYCNQHIWLIENGVQGARIDIVTDFAEALGMELTLKGRETVSNELKERRQ